jgi:hypothetical protein
MRRFQTTEEWSATPQTGALRSVNAWAGHTVPLVRRETNGCIGDRKGKPLRTQGAMQIARSLLGQTSAPYLSTDG